ncbi:hypothetical protein LG943_23990 [Streptomonospora sp. S1-112]|uniref:Uncharacterized protein n=1 Tax=Streptomonospora mangrovi TaxID=2883123 RepID=A0A9X3SFY1_9ACTN|nr:hypothetical protein [Streptomonospora mangrovi]MDA0567358.1 hypothetical protein [Streptomonospora mangrovi]
MSPTDPAPPDDPGARDARGVPETPGAPNAPGPPRRRYGFTAWAVFVAAILAVLTLVTGCLSVLYGPLLTGG